LLELINHRYLFCVEGLTNWMVLLKGEELPEILTGPHIASIYQRLHITIENDPPLFNRLVVTNFKERLTW
jgi:hypothetical protein